MVLYYYDDYIAPACAELFHYIWLQFFLLAVSISFLSRRALVYMYGTQENKGKTGFYAVSGPHRSRRDSSNFIRPMSIEEAHDPDEIDYTKARKGPQIQAALSGKLKFTVNKIISKSYRLLNLISIIRWSDDRLQ